jgi:uncharacterized phiE125 gp8 family phage protein
MTPTYTVITAATEEPITLGEAAAQVRQDSSDDNDYLSSLITTVREAYEEEHGLFFVSTTLDVHFPRFPAGGVLKFTRGPLASVASVKYITADDDEETFASTNYDVDTRRSRVWLKDSALWPTATLRPMDPVVVRCVMGFGAATAAPQRAKHAMLMDIDHLYSHRSNVTLEAVALEAKEMARASAHLMATLRNWNL